MTTHQDEQDRKTPTPSENSDTRPVFSSEKILMDYTTAKGIHQRTGIDKVELLQFVMKELLDNAVELFRDQWPW